MDSNANNDINDGTRMSTEQGFSPSHPTRNNQQSHSSNMNEIPTTSMMPITTPSQNSTTATMTSNSHTDNNNDNTISPMPPMSMSTPTASTNNDNNNNNNSNNENTQLPLQSSSTTMNESSSTIYSATSDTDTAGGGGVAVTPFFFADATLDLEDARVIEETPDVKHSLPHQQNNEELVELQSSGTVGGDDGDNFNMDANRNANRNHSNGNSVEIATSNVGIQLRQFHPTSSQNNLNSTTIRQSNENNTTTTSTNTTSNNDNNNDNGNNNNTIQPQRIVHNINAVNLAPTSQPKAPRRPRDTNYILIFIPCLLFMIIPLLFSCQNSNIAPPLSSSSSSTSINHTTFPTITTTIIAIILSRIIYSSRGGNGEGDDRRYSISTTLFVSNLVTCLAMPILTLQIYYLNVTAAATTTTTTTSTTTKDGLEEENMNINGNLNSLYYTWYRFLVFGLVFSSIREVFIFATLFKSNRSSSSTTTSSSRSNNNNVSDVSVPALPLHILNNNTNTIGGINLNESINDGQRTMFRMIVNVALDILSRSLRPQIVFRFVSLCIMLQLCIVYIVKKSFICAIRSTSSSASSSWRIWYALFIGYIGFWIIFTLIKLLALVCSGGITTWFAQQSLLIERMERMTSEQQNEEGMTISDDDDDDDDDDDVDAQGVNVDSSLMPEAYRNVDANVYSSALEFDDGMDDEYVDEYEFDHDTTMNGNSSSEMLHDRSQRMNRNSKHGISQGMTNGISTQGIGGGGVGDNYGGSGRDWQNINVKSFLIYGITISFGSVLQCALFGPLSNWIGKIFFYIDKIVSLIASSILSSQRRWNRSISGTQLRVIGGQSLDQLELNDNGVDSMSIYDETFSNLTIRDKVYVLWKKFGLKTKSFIKNHNDLGLCHVAAYHKSYQKASSDVLTLMNASGTSTILEDDISSHMCTSICKAISCVLVIIVGHPLSLRRSGLDHSTVCEIMVITYIMCYMILSTMIEPLRASVKAVYVSYAQHPQSLSQAFPLLYHRLSRISE